MQTRECDKKTDPDGGAELHMTKRLQAHGARQMVSAASWLELQHCWGRGGRWHQSCCQLSSTASLCP